VGKVVIVGKVAVKHVRRIAEKENSKTFVKFQKLPAVFKLTLVAITY
jgi:hypothetical protein